MARKRKRRSKKKKLWSKQSEFTRKDGTIVVMDSTWEVMMANRLNELDITWVRDPKMKLEYKTRGKRNPGKICILESLAEIGRLTKDIKPTLGTLRE